jgi:hypothetical protein
MDERVHLTPFAGVVQVQQAQGLYRKIMVSAEERRYVPERWQDPMWVNVTALSCTPISPGVTEATR